MKIQCDVCENQEAAVFCAADEAALCEICDHRVHQANKLAGKHLRFALLHPSFKDAPLCDICQERRAFLFCKEDRAILCRECDIPIHKANEHTQKHSRFLLTGVHLSAASSAYPAPSSSSSAATASYTSNNTINMNNEVLHPMATTMMMMSSGSYNGIGEEGSISMPDYWPDTTVPGGWRLDDLVDSSASHSYYF